MSVYFGIHQVADPDERAGDADSDRDAVERPDVGHFVLARKKPQTDEQTDGRAVAGQSSLMNVEDLDGMGQIVSRIVEQAMPESGADDRRQHAVPEDRVEQLVGISLPLDDAAENVRADTEREGPHQAVIADFERAYRNHRGIHVPANEKGQDSIHRALAVIPQAKRPEGEFPRAGAFRSVRSARHAGTNVPLFCSK